MRINSIGNDYFGTIKRTEITLVNIEIINTETNIEQLQNISQEPIVLESITEPNNTVNPLMKGQNYTDKLPPPNLGVKVDKFDNNDFERSFGFYIYDKNSREYKFCIYNNEKSNKNKYYFNIVNTLNTSTGEAMIEAMIEVDENNSTPLSRNNYILYEKYK
jgi:hypothetical protein